MIKDFIRGVAYMSAMIAWMTTVIGAIFGVVVLISSLDIDPRIGGIVGCALVLLMIGGIVGVMDGRDRRKWQ